MFQKRDLSNDQFGEATAAFFSKKGKKTLEIIECRSLSLYLFSVRRHRGLSDRKSVAWNAGRVMSKYYLCSSPQTGGSSVSVEDLPQVSGILDRQMMENQVPKPQTV